MSTHRDFELVSQMLRGVIVLAMTAASVFVGVSLVETLRDDTLPSAVGVDLDTGAFTGDLPPTADLVAARGTVELEAGTGWRVTWWAFTAAPALLAIAGLLIMFRIVGSRDDPFTSVNVRRFSWLAGIALAYLAVEIVRSPVEIAMKDSLGLERLDTSIEFGLPAFLSLVFLALASIWRRGVALRTEQELTI
jgi:hypothetical protein